MSFPAPPAGDRIRTENGQLVVPDKPVIPYIEGDGIGVDLWPATQRVLDAAVEKAYGGQKGIIWYEIFAGEKANNEFGEWLPEKTVQAARDFQVAIKGPLTTPGRRRHPQPERRAAPAPRPLRLRAPGAPLFRRALRRSGARKIWTW